MPTSVQSLQAVAAHHGQTPTQAALQTSLFSPELVDIKFWVFSRRVDASASQLGGPTSFRVVNPLPVYGISLVLLHTEYFRQLLSSGFTESSAETTFYASYPPKEQDFMDDYDYDSDSDLEDESGVGYENWEVEVPQPRVVRKEATAVRCELEPAPVEMEVSQMEMEWCSPREEEPEDTVETPCSIFEVEGPRCSATLGSIYASEDVAFRDDDDDDDDASVRLIMPELTTPPAPEPSETYQSDIDDKRSPGLGAPCRQVIIKHAAFLTFRALIYYLYTGQVKFLPLRNQDPASRNATTRRLLANRESTVEPPACSPKSMYRLANMLGIAQLEEQALEAIRTSLTPPIILHECLTPFTSNYKAVVLMEIQYLCDNYGDGRVKSRWPEAIAYMLSGDCAHAGEVVTILLRDRLIPNPNPLARNVGYQQPRSWY